MAHLSGCRLGEKKNTERTDPLEDGRKFQPSKKRWVSVWIICFEETSSNAEK